ncbi:MAG: hypothetical protein K2X39_04865, partial [Silvanigrellaceae bacterium]|nr:hypothetical protein [Silvanigrellaceae bacterium]
MKLANKALVLIIFYVVFFISCKTFEPLVPGIQSRYEAINPGAILALPIVYLPDPGHGVVIDHGLIHSWGINSLLEEKILATFADQPNVHGIDFKSVRKALQQEPMSTSQQEKSIRKTLQQESLFDPLEKQMLKVAKRFSSTNPAVRSMVSARCLARKNFLDFYQFCLAEDSSWIEGLNKISEKAFHADAAFFTVVNSLSMKQEVGSTYRIESTVSILLVDTNNGD